MLWNGNYEFKTKFYWLKQIVQCFLAKPCMCNTLWLLEEIGGNWEQFHDWYFPQLPAEYLPREVFWEETISWVFFAEKLPLTGMRCFSEVFWEEKHLLDIVSQKQISCECCTSFASCKVKKIYGRFQLEALRDYQCKQILGLCHSPPQMENQCGMWKNLWGNSWQSVQVSAWLDSQLLCATLLWLWQQWLFLLFFYWRRSLHYWDGHPTVGDPTVGDPTVWQLSHSVVLCRFCWFFCSFWCQVS